MARSKKIKHFYASSICDVREFYAWGVRGMKNFTRETRHMSSYFDIFSFHFTLNLILDEDDTYIMFIEGFTTEPFFPVTVHVEDVDGRALTKLSRFCPSFENVVWRCSEAEILESVHDFQSDDCILVFLIYIDTGENTLYPQSPEGTDEISNKVVKSTLACLQSFRNDLSVSMLREDEDIVFTCSGRKFKAHKAFLCARSKVFEAMLSSSCTNEVEIRNVDPKTFLHFIDYLYTAELPTYIKGDVTKRLYDIANEYAVEALASRCLHTLRRIMANESSLLMVIPQWTRFQETEYWLQASEPYFSEN